ncbi:MAG: TonB family protein [Verrucomicrobiota bacterium]
MAKAPENLISDSVSAAPIEPAQPSTAMELPPLIREEISLLGVGIAVIWICCLIVGVVGLRVPYARSKPAPGKAAPVQAELLDVQLAVEPIPSAPAPLPSELVQPPALLEARLPDAPPMIAVAQPSPTIAFALPVEGPARLVEAGQASYTRPAERPPDSATAAPPVQTITYGRGEGKQPAPEYPPRAVREGQEGTVQVRFDVDPDGHVLQAVAASPSPWRLLNEAAVRTVRERWHFQPGAFRRYEVAIHFELTK